MKNDNPGNHWSDTLGSGDIALTSKEMKFLIHNYIQTQTSYFIQLRHQIHANPELGFAEFITSQLVADELTKMGVSFNKYGTGIVAIIDSGKTGKTIALRAELDALPINEQTELPFQSKHLGYMHACGHDGHVASLLATAKALNNFKYLFSGKVKLIFQPAEENCLGGAKKMIEFGVLENPKVDAIFAFHNHPGYPQGTILSRYGSVLSGNTHFDLHIKGKGGHAATPEHNIDPILIGSMITQTFPILTQQIATSDAPVTMRITEFYSGVSRNVVPDSAILKGTIRTTNLKQRELAKQRLSEMVSQITLAQGGIAEIAIKDMIPPTINTDNETSHVLKTAIKILGEKNVQKKPLPARASEDFAFYLEKIPGCYFFIGSGENSPSCHSAFFDFNDNILPIAAELLCHITIDYLNADQNHLI